MQLDAWIAAFRDPAYAFRVSAALLGTGQIVTSLEYLCMRKEFASGGVYPWPVLRLSMPPRPAPIHRLREMLFCERGVVMLLTVRLLLASMLLVLSWIESVARLAVVALSAVLLLFNVRLPWGMEGADDIAVHVSLGLAAFAVTRWFDAPSLGLYYIAAYAGLAYVTAGVTKLAEPTWRDGVALEWVVNLQAFGARWAMDLLAPRPRLRCALSWLVMLAEVCAPLALLLPARGIAIALAAGLVFHVTLAVCMGLNTFVWAFLATYPGVLLVWTTLHTVAPQPSSEGRAVLRRAPTGAVVQFEERRYRRSHGLFQSSDTQLTVDASRWGVPSRLCRRARRASPRSRRGSRLRRQSGTRPRAFPAGG